MRAQDALMRRMLRMAERKRGLVIRWMGLALACLIVWQLSCQRCGGGLESKGGDAMVTLRAEELIDDYLEQYMPLDRRLRKAWYAYNTTGDKAALKEQTRLELEIRTLQSDVARFQAIFDLFRARDAIQDPLLRRQVELLYRGHLPYQVSTEKLAQLTKLEKRLEERFNDFRAEVDGRKLSSVDVAHILVESTESAQLEKVWKAQQVVSRVLEGDFRALVRLRNEIARELGYEGALELMAEVSEMDLGMLDRFYHDVHEATEQPFRRLKAELLDPKLASRFGIAVEALQPWHYQNAFFQEVPNATFEAVDLDAFYAGIDASRLIDQTVDLYASFGVDIRKVVERSSLFPKPGKNPHAVAWYLDPQNAASAVLIMNLPNPPEAPKASDASTLVHELAHDINYEAILSNHVLPYLLREPTMLTEAVAMLFERQTQTADWFERLGTSTERAIEAASSMESFHFAHSLIFLRWASCMYCFEREFYADPEQDIGDLWWRCREQHQLLTRPEGWREADALAKYHITNAPPLYYSTYALGEIANVQFAELFAKRLGKGAQAVSFYGERELGSWLMKDFLAQGERYPWDAFLLRTTGKPISVEAWKEHYIGSEAERRLYR